MRRIWWSGILALCCLITSGCGLLNKFVKKSVSVAQVLQPLENAETAQLLADVNRVAAVRSLKAKVDLEFEDLSAAGAGIAEKYKRADGTVYVQRPGQIYLTIEGPLSTKIAELASDGTQFRVAVMQGEERYRRFIMGTNSADYSRLQADDVENNGKPNRAKMMASDKKKVGVFSQIRPQHFTEGLLLNPIVPPAENKFVYVKSETVNEEEDTRPNAKKGARVVRGYYLLDEVALNGDNTGHVLRRFWFDRYQGVRLARVQIFDAAGAMTTDVTYDLNKPVGESNTMLPTRMAVRRPQEKYGLVITYQSPSEVQLGKEFNSEIFVLQNRTELPVINLDELLQRKKAED